MHGNALRTAPTSLTNDPYLRRMSLWRRVGIGLCALLVLGVTLMQACHVHRPAREHAAFAARGDGGPATGCPACSVLHFATTVAPALLGISLVYTSAGLLRRSSVHVAKQLAFPLSCRPPPPVAA